MRKEGSPKRPRGSVQLHLDSSLPPRCLCHLPSGASRGLAVPTISSLTNVTSSFILSFQKSQSWYNVSIPFLLWVHVSGRDGDVVGGGEVWCAGGAVCGLSRRRNPGG